MSRIIGFILSAVFGFLAIFGIGGTSPFAKKPTDIEVAKDIAYGDHPLQKFDLYIPEGIGNELSIAIHIHGGAWTGGDKEEYVDRLVKPYAQEKNMISATINYRLLTGEDSSINCWTMLEDIDDAVGKIVEVCNEKGYTIKKALVWGESAGGHLALMYSYLYKDKSAVDIALCYPICPPTDLTDTKYFTDDEISPEQMYFIHSRLTGTEINVENRLSEETIQAQLKVSPISYVSSDCVPTIFNSCGKDTAVPKENGDELHEALKEAGVKHFYMVFPNSAHCSVSSKDSNLSKIFEFNLNQMIDKYVK